MANLKVNNYHNLKLRINKDEYWAFFVNKDSYGQLMLDGLYDECLRESLILGIFLMEGESFCGLAEMYGLRNAIHKVSIGYRLAEPYWSKGIASETVSLMTGYLFRKARDQCGAQALEGKLPSWPD